MGSGLTSGAAAQVSKIGRFGVWRMALTWAVLIAFALQSYVTQTHVHWETVAPAASSAGSAIQSPQPGDSEATACPLCQAVAAAGAFVGAAPIAVSWPVVRAAVAVPPPIVVGLAVRAAGFSWQSRAPPQF